MADSHSEDRRSFLRYLLICGAGLVAFSVAWGIGRFSLFRSGRSVPREFPKDLLARLEPDVPSHLPLPRAWLLRRGSDGDIRALDDRCTHLGCKQMWNAEHKRYECPCHGSQFDVEGNVLRGPANRPLQRLLVSSGQDDNLRLLDRPAGS